MSGGPLVDSNVFGYALSRCFAMLAYFNRRASWLAVFGGNELPEGFR